MPMEFAFNLRNNEIKNVCKIVEIFSICEKKTNNDCGCPR